MGLTFKPSLILQWPRDWNPKEYDHLYFKVQIRFQCCHMVYMLPYTMYSVDKTKQKLRPWNGSFDPWTTSASIYVCSWGKESKGCAGEPLPLCYLAKPAPPHVPNRYKGNDGIAWRRRRRRVREGFASIVKRQKTPFKRLDKQQKIQPCYFLKDWGIIHITNVRTTP